MTTKDDTSTPITDESAPNEFERDKPGTSARTDAEGAIEELRRRGGVFVNAVRATRMPMALTDPNLPGNPIVFANDAFVKLTGYSMDEVLGQQPHFMNGPGTDPRDARRFEEAIRADQDDIIETVQYRKGGGRFVATVLISAFKDANGRTLNHFMSWLDVTRRVDAEGEVADLREAQLRLRASEERQAFLLKLSDALRPLADAGEIQSTTTRLVAEHLQVDRSMYGEVEGERGAEKGIIRGQHVRGTAIEPFPEHFTFRDFGEEAMAWRYRGEPLVVADIDTAAGFEPAERDAWRAANVGAAVVIPLVKEGRLVAEFGVHCTQPRRWTDAEVSLLASVADRTWAAAERARAEEALRKSEEKYRTLFETIDSGYALTENVRDDEGRVVDLFGVDFNRSYTQHSGLPPFQGRRASEVITVEPEWLRQFEEVTRTGIPARYENYIAERDRWVSTHYSLVGDLGSDRVAVVFDDITGRKRAEAALRETSERQEFLLRLTDALRTLSDPLAIQETASRLTAEHLDIGRIAYCEIRKVPEPTAVIERDWARPDMPSMAGHHRIVDFGAFLGDEMPAGRPVIVSDARTDDRLSKAERDHWEKLGLVASYNVPIFKDRRLIAYLVAHDNRPHHWTGVEVAILGEVADRTWAAVERTRAEEALRESEEKYSALFAASPAPSLILRPDAPRFTIADVNDAYLAATMRAREELVGRPMFDAFPDNPDDSAATGVSNLRAALERALASRRFELMDVQKYDIVRPDGTFEERWWKPANAPAVDANGKVLAIIHHVADVTVEQRAVEALRESHAHQQILLAELQHRVRNTLAVVRSIARRTAENTETSEDMLYHFQGRLDAFSRVQSALTRSADAKVSITTLIEDELVAHAAGDGEQVRIDGPEIELDSRAAERLSLAIHELTTNAVKHGALSNHHGRIQIRWRHEDSDDGERLVLKWKESGLEIETNPEREGFGMELLRRSLPYDLQAETNVELHRGGLEFNLVMPLREPAKVG